MAGHWIKRGKESYLLVVDLGTDFKGARVRRTKTIHCKSDRQADKELSKFYVACESGKNIYSDKMPISGMCEKYMKNTLHIKTSTRASYDSIIRTKINPFFGNAQIDKVTRLHIQEWVNFLYTERKLSAKTIQEAYSLLGNIFDAAIKWGFLSRNPCELTELPKRHKKESDSYTVEEVTALVDCILKDSENWMTIRAAALLALFSGMRLGEICGLSWENIDYANECIRIEKTRLYRAGEGTYIETPKTQKSRRTISVPTRCLDLLRKLKKHQLESRLVLGSKWGSDEGFVFLTDLGDPVSPPGLSKRFTVFLEKHGLRKINFHALRHTHTSMLADMNLDIAQISRRLGHSQISTTQNIYMHIFSDRDKEIADRLNERFANNSPTNEKSNA